MSFIQKLNGDKNTAKKTYGTGWEEKRLLVRTAHIHKPNIKYLLPSFMCHLNKPSLAKKTKKQKRTPQNINKITFLFSNWLGMRGRGQTLK